MYLTMGHIYVKNTCIQRSKHERAESRDGAVGWGSIPRLGIMCGLNLLVLYSAQRGFSPGSPVFPSSQKPV